jgi:type IV pilus assembly protein PilO
VRLTKANWILAGLLLAMVLAAVLGLYLPQSRKLSQIQSQIVNHKLAMDNDLQSCQAVPELARQVVDMKNRYRNLDRRLPKQKELGGFLKEISTNLLQAKLTNQTIEPGKPDSAELYRTLPIVMKFEGNYLSLANFLKRIDGMERLTRVQKMNIGLDREAGKDKPLEKVNIELQLNIYFTES